MQERISKSIEDFGLPRIIIIAFLIFLSILSVIVKIPYDDLIVNSLVRTGMNGILVLAMVPGILGGIGLNFGLPLGILCGLLGGLISIELNLVGWQGFSAAILFSIPFASIVGFAYGWLLNKVKGSEMMVATYVGFSAVSLMSIGWMMLPFKSPEMAWPIGKGVRTTIALSGRFDKILNTFLEFNMGPVKIPTGLILFNLLLCGLMWLFLRSKAGITMRAAGENPKFAVTAGINVDKSRIIGTMLSTILGAIGIIVYSQSFGFLQLYQAPMFMGFAAVAAILIGGATVKKASIANVLIGTFLFQTLLVVALPVANKIMTLGSLAEVTRVVVSNGIILYALTQVRGGE